MKKGSMPTMKDVAQEAGVSLGTVSKVFNGIPVGKMYQQQVQEAAARLGYRLNRYARGLKSGKTLTVALILPSLQTQFFSTLAQKICESLRERERQMLLFIAQPGMESEQDCMRRAVEHQVDGVIAVTYSDDLRKNSQVRLVTIDRLIAPDVPCVSSDNYGGGQMAAQKLIELGCKRLLGVHIACAASSEPDKRIDGFCFACRSAGVEFSVCVDNQQQGEQIISFLEQRLRDGTPDFDGIFCSNDDLAYRVGSVLREHGVKVPEQVQIIGYDGVKKFEGRDLFCSTMIQPVKEMADTAVDLVLNSDGTSPSILACLPVSYMAGGTTKDSVQP